MILTRFGTHRWLPNLPDWKSQTMYIIGKLCRKAFGSDINLGQCCARFRGVGSSKYDVYVSDVYSGGDLAPSWGGTNKFFADLNFFLVIDQVFKILRFFTLLNVIYDLFFARKNTISEKNSLMTPLLLLCSYFRAHLTTLLL